MFKSWTEIVITYMHFTLSLYYIYVSFIVTNIIILKEAVSALMPVALYLSHFPLLTQLLIFYLLGYFYWCRRL